MRDLKRIAILKRDEEQQKHTEDEVVVEEPLEIRVNGASLSVTMRTPGNDFDLALGFLLTEGIIGSPGEVGTMGYCPDEKNPGLRNIMDVRLVAATRQVTSSRFSWSNSSCGLCGKATLEAVRQVCKPIASNTAVPYDVIY